MPIAAMILLGWALCTPALQVDAPPAATPAATAAPSATPAPTLAPAPAQSDAANAESFDAVAEKIAAAWNRHSTLRAQVNSLMRTPNARRTVEVRGTIVVQRRDGSDAQQMDTTTVTTLGEGEHSSSTILNQLELCDGENSYITRNIGADTQILKIDPLYLQRVAGAELCEQLRTLHTPTVMPPQRLNDQDVYVIESRPKRPLPPLDRMVSYISPQDGVLLKVVLLDSAGAELRTLNLFDWEFDKEIDPATFEFTPPPDGEVVDQTTAPKAPAASASLDPSSQTQAESAGKAAPGAVKADEPK